MLAYTSRHICRYLLESIQNHSDLCSKNVPENRAADGLAKAISLAFKEFGEPWYTFHTGEFFCNVNL